MLDLVLILKKKDSKFSAASGVANSANPLEKLSLMRSEKRYYFLEPRSTPSSRGDTSAGSWGLPPQSARASHSHRRNEGFAVAEMGGHGRGGRAPNFQKSYLHDYLELSELPKNIIFFLTSLNSVFSADLPNSQLPMIPMEFFLRINIKS